MKIWFPGKLAQVRVNGGSLVLQRRCIDILVTFAALGSQAGIIYKYTAVIQCNIYKRLASKGIQYNLYK